MEEQNKKLIFADVDPHHCFILKNGESIKNLDELAKALNSMEHDVFLHHVNEEKNDFSNWVNDVLGDENLAVAIAKAKTSKQAVSAIKEKSREIRTVKKDNRKEKNYSVIPEVVRAVENTKKPKAVAEKKPKAAKPRKQKQKQKLAEPGPNYVEKQDMEEEYDKGHTGVITFNVPKNNHRNHFELHSGMRDYIIGMLVGVAAGMFIGLLI